MIGIISKEIDGKVRNFHFGTQMFLHCEEEGINVGEISRHMKEKTFTSLVTIAYCAAISYCELKGIKPDFRKVDVSSWVDEIGIADFMNMIVEGVKVHEPKNTEALEIQGQAGQSTNT